MQSLADLLQSHRVPAVRFLALQNLRSRIRPSCGGQGAEIDLSGFQAASTCVEDDSRSNEKHENKKHSQDNLGGNGSEGI